MPMRVIALALALIAGCAVHPPAPAAAGAVETRVREAWISATHADEELDSLATWRAGPTDRWLLASAKSSHRLLVFDADDGRLLRTFGREGTAPGEFRRPNGLAVAGDLLFVVERDGRRVQVLRLPGFTPVASFGGGVLRSPYGIWVHETAPGRLEAWVTDSFMDGAAFDVVPRAAELDRRLRRFTLRRDAGGGLAVGGGDGFGDTAGGALRMVESIAGDPAHDRLLIADEYTGDGHSTLRDYTLDGRYRGHSVPAGTFQAEAEGVALWPCGEAGGYWLVVDQVMPLSRFLLFDRDSLDARGVFRGAVTAFTDGIAVDPSPSTRFPQGALYAVHADRALTAFDLGDVARALSLDPACLPPARPS